MDHDRNKFLWLGLRVGMLVPFLYFGIQIAASPFYPGYSFIDQDASSLGSSASTFPMLFNIGALITGLTLICFALAHAFHASRLRLNRYLRIVMVVALSMIGLGCVNAAIFPLPDPRHTGAVANILALGIPLCTFVSPFLYWRDQRFRVLKVLLLCNAGILLLMFPIITGLAQRLMGVAGVESAVFQEFLNNYHGLLQRIVASSVFLPIGAMGYVHSRIGFDNPITGPSSKSD